MREKLAKALYWVGYEARVREEDRLTPDLAWKRCGPEQRTFNLAQVDAILAALSEPSEAGLAAQRIEHAYFMENLRLYLKAAGEE